MSIFQKIAGFAMAATLFSVSVQAQEKTPVYDVPRVENIGIDGLDSDWQARGFRIEALADDARNVRSVADFDAKVRLGWDERGLLILARVADDVTLEAEKSSDLWQRDSIEIFVANARGGADSYQVMIGAGLSPAQPAVRTAVINRAKTAEIAALAPEATVARTAVAGGYVLEALLPWQNLRIAPQKGREIGFQILFNDVDSGNRRVQSLWFPEAGTDTSKMQRLRLADKPSPAIEMAARAALEQLRRARIQVVAAPQMAGKAVEVREGGKVRAKSRLTALEPGRAGATLQLSALEFGARYAPLEVRVDGKTLGNFTLSDPTAERRETLGYAKIAFMPFVFSGDEFPDCEFEDFAWAENLVGHYTLQTKFYDANFEEVRVPREPGRYGAVTEITLGNGEKFRRYSTLFRQPKEIDWYRAGLSFGVEMPADAGFDATVIREQNAQLSSYFRRLWSDDIFRNPQSAVLMAGLWETRAGQPQVERTGAARLDANWWYRLKQKVGLPAKYQRIIDLPPDYDADPSKKWPLMLFLHGAGETGTDLKQVQKHGPPRLVAEGKRFPFVLVSPQLPEHGPWLPDQLNDLLDQISADYRIDPDRIYVTGLSRGGKGTWDLALTYPDRFAAIAPMAAWGDGSDVARLKTLPVWAFHGTEDSSVQFSRGEATVKALENAGGKVKWTVYPGVGHDSWTQSYLNPELYEWFLQHRRSDRN